MLRGNNILVPHLEIEKMNDVANEIIQNLGLAMGRDGAVPDEWQQLVAVYKVGLGTIGGWNTAYLSKEREVDYYFSSDKPYELAKRLHDVMIDDKGNSWVACKVTLVRETRDINIKFEYNDEDYWDPTLPF